MKNFRVFFLFLLALAAAAFLSPAQLSCAGECREAARKLNEALHPPIDEEELSLILEVLNRTGNRDLPPKFVTKKQAERLGWKRGTDLWAYEGLKGKSIGGDRFGNREGKLPGGKRVWREADLDYKGGRRGPKRIVYSDDGLRRVTVNHYQTFREVPPCR